MDNKYINMSDINNMKIWSFYIAQKKWRIKPEECIKIFEENKLFECITEGYDYLHLMSYKSVVKELEEIIEYRGMKDNENSN